MSQGKSAYAGVGTVSGEKLNGRNIVDDAPGAVTEQTVLLDVVLSQAHETLTRLENKLDGVLLPSPSPQAEQGNVPEPIRSEIAQKLYGVHGGIFALMQRINQLNERIDL